MAKGHWLHLSGIFVLDQFAWVLLVVGPIPMKIVLDTLADKPALPAIMNHWIPQTWGKTDLVVLAVVMQLSIALLAMGRDALNHVLCTYTGEKLTLALRGRLFRHAQKLSLAFHDSHGTSDSIYRIQYDTQSIQWIVIYGVGPLCASIISLAAMLLVMALLNWKLAMVALAVTPLLVIIPRFFKGVGAQRYRVVKEQEADALKVIQEVLTSIRVVKAFGREDDEQDRFLNRSRATVKAKLQLAIAEGGLSMAIKLTTALGAAAVLYIGVRDILGAIPTVTDVESRQLRVMTVGELTMALAYTAQLYAPLENITKKIADIQWSLASVNRAFELLDQSPDVPDKPNATTLSHVRGEITFDHVHFAYAGEKNNPILHNVSFSVPPGARVGIVGKTGAGKSTLVSLLMRFYDPTSGRVLLDGTDVTDLRLDHLRDQFSIVLQEPVLFSTSIGENIAYSKPGATIQQIIDAATAANADDFIRQFPQGYDTQVGERGMRLSGGERQRISLARAFLKNAPVLIMDEPTSSVDVQTEKRIMQAMQRLMQNRTCFLITHRPSTLHYCNRILAVESGAIVEKTVAQALTIMEENQA